MVEEWEIQQDHQKIDNAFMNCGASKRYLTDVGFDKCRTLEVGNFEERRNQMIYQGVAKQFFNEIIKENKYGNLVLSGPPGIGKTFLSLCCIKGVCSIGFDVVVKNDAVYADGTKAPDYKCKGYYRGLYRTSDYLIEEISRAKSFSSKVSKNELIEKYGTVKLLVIDEIGRTSRKEEKDILFSVLDKRYQECLPSILCTNYSYERLTDILGEAMTSRLEEKLYKASDATVNNMPNMRWAKAQGLL